MDALTIATVAVETGLAKEVLRKWESRYGFPVPVRDDAGNRVYSSEQTARLKLIKRLMDEGMRPGQIVGLDEDSLLQLIARKKPDASDAAQPESSRQLIGWLQTRDPELLRKQMGSELARAGLGSFVLDVLPVMNRLVGEAWMDGEIAIRDEHLYTEIVQGLLREASYRLTDFTARPRILLATPSGELHTLGVLMVESVLSINGACCTSLGAQLPIPEIVMAAQEYQADVVGLSFSASFPVRKIPPLLKSLRMDLPDEIQLWAGGGGIAALERTPRGVVLLPHLSDAVAALEKFRQRFPHKSKKAVVEGGLG